MLDPIDYEEPKGKIDLATVLYIAFGVPGIVGFLVLFFSAVKYAGIPG